MLLITEKTTIGEFGLWMNWLPNADSRIRRFNCLVFPALELSRYPHLQMYNLSKLLKRPVFLRALISFSLKFNQIKSLLLLSGLKELKRQRGCRSVKLLEARSVVGKMQALLNMKGCENDTCEGIHGLSNETEANYSLGVSKTIILRILHSANSCIYIPFSLDP